MKKIKVAIDFRAQDPRQGVGTAVQALAHGLSRLDKADQEYVFIVQEQNLDFFRPYVSGSCSIVGVRNRRNGLKAFLKAKAKKLPSLQKLWVSLHPGESLLPASDGTAENLGCDVIHFPSQTAYTSNLPTIYQPWDLQHCHYPEFFSEQDLRLRAVYYPGFCRRAKYVCVQTEWTKKDVSEKLGIDLEKIVVIRWGTAFEAHKPLSTDAIAAIREQLNLPEVFFLYPAVTWPHKNHELILRALAILKEETGQRFHVVFTGSTTSYREHLDTLAKELGIIEQLQFAGFVDKDQIQALFHLATALLFPSKFEGLGLPVLEAFRMNLPVISSSATVLSEVTAGAAILVDPDSPEELANAMRRISDDSSLREDLIAKGSRVLPSYSADTAALQFAHLYQAAVRSSSV